MRGDSIQPPDEMKDGSDMRTRKIGFKKGSYGRTIPKSRGGKHKRKKGKGRR